MPQVMHRSFTSGEIAPALQSRADLSKYATGLALCQKFIVRSQGGVYSRPGLRFVGELADPSRRARLIPFSFNTEQTYILVFEHFRVRIIRDGGYVLADGGPTILEVATPYSEDQLLCIGFTQSADVLTLVHPSHEPRNLSRIADDNWTLDVIDFGPTVSTPSFSLSVGTNPITNINRSNPAVFTSPGHSLSVGQTALISGIGPSTGITVLASQNGLDQLNGSAALVVATTANTVTLQGVDGDSFFDYESANDGGILTGGSGLSQVGSGFGDFDRTYTYVVTAVDSNGVESLPSAPASVTSPSLSQTGGIRLTWGAVTGADHYRVYKDGSLGTSVYGWIGDSRNNTFDDYNIAPITSDSPPEDRQPFSGEGNAPSAVTYYQQRLVFANTNNEPQTVFTTQTANFQSLRTSTPARADDAVTFTLAARQVNEVRHLLPLDSLIMLTSGGEWILSEGQDRVLTPSTVGARIQSYNGCSLVPPVVVNLSLIHI